MSLSQRSRLKVTAAVIALSAYLGACGSNPRPRIKDIETIVSSVGSTEQTIARSELDYDNDRLAAINQTRDGAAIARMTLAYDDDRLSVIEVKDAANELMVRWQFEFLNGRVSRRERQEPIIVATSPEIVTSLVRRSERLTWGSNGVSHIEVTDTQPVAEDAETIEDWLERYRYDDDGRLVRVTGEHATTPSVTELRYDEESGELQQVESQVDGMAPSVVSFSFDSGQLQRASEGSARYDIEYKDGRMHEIIFRAGSTTATTRYTYSDGDLNGIMPAPEMPFGYLFGMHGKFLDDPDYANLGRLD